MLTPAAAPTPRQSVLAAEEVGNRALIGVTKQVTDLGSVELQRPGVCICWVASTCRWNAPPNAWRKRSAPGRVNPNWPQDDGLDSSERRNTQSVEVVVEEPETSKKVPGPAPLTKQREEHARLIARGVSNSEACRTVKVNRRTGTRWLYGRTVPGTNGFTREYPPVNSTLKPSAPRSIRYLSEEDRGVIADMRRAKASMRAIALAIERDVSTISRELARNTDDSGRYRPSLAQQLATRRLARPRARKVATDPILAAIIQGWPKNMPGARAPRPR